MHGFLFINKRLRPRFSTPPRDLANANELKILFDLYIVNKLMQFMLPLKTIFSVTDTIDEVVTVIYVMELTINQILARPEDLDVLFLNVTYAIVPGSEYIVAMTTCPSSLVDTQGVCGKFICK